MRWLGCRRRWFQSDLEEIVDAAQEELKGSRSLLGCRAMHLRIIIGLVTTREVVRHILRAFDPERVEYKSFKITKETSIFQYKIIHNILPVGVLVQEMGEDR